MRMQRIEVKYSEEGRKKKMRYFLCLFLYDETEEDLKMMVRRFVEVGVGLEMYRWITVLLHVLFLTVMLHVFLFFYFSFLSFFSLFSWHRGELVPEWWDSFILLLLTLFFEVCTIEWDLQLKE